MAGTRMLQRRGSGPEWAASNPILGDGELGWNKDTQEIKIGDGLTAWNDLPTYFVLRTIVDAKGDLLVGVADNVLARLPAGSTGQHLEVAADGSLVWVTMPAFELAAHAAATYATIANVAATYETLADVAARMADKSTSAQQNFTGNVEAPQVLDASGRVYSPGNPPPGNIAMNLIDAKGDLILGTADNTVARQAVGADRTLLQADSSQANGVKWVPDGSRKWTRNFMMMGA